MQKKNDNIVSYFKGIAIILVVLGHAGFTSLGVRFIYAFHMALFYFASGMLFKARYLDEPKTFVKRKVLGLYIPFIKYSLLFLFAHDLLVVMNCHTGMYGWEEIKNGVIKIFLFLNVDLMQSHMWFMRSLFVSLLLFYFSLFAIKRIKQNPSRVGLVFFPLMMLVGLLLAQNNIILPIRIEREFVCTSLIAFGYYFPRESFEKLGMANLSMVAIVSFVVLYMIVLLTTDKIGVADSHFINPLYFIIVSLMGILLVYGIAVILEKNWGGQLLILRYIGNNTLVIYVFHILFFRIVNYIKVLFYGWDVSRVAEIEILYENNNLMWSFAYLFVGVSIPLLVNYMYDFFKSRLKQNAE